MIRYPGSVFSVGNLHDYWLESARLIDTGEKLEITHEPTRDTIKGLPEIPPDDISTVVKLKIRNKTEEEKNERAAVALDESDSIL